MRKLKRCLKNFPKQVVKKMLENQVEQGNIKSIEVFENNIYSSMSCRGFDWSRTKEGHSFWSDVLPSRNFELFFEKYPKKKKKNIESGITPKMKNHIVESKKKLMNKLNNNSYPKLMFVRQSEKADYQKKLIICDIKINGKTCYISLLGIETIEDLDNSDICVAIRWFHSIGAAF